LPRRAPVFRARSQPSMKAARGSAKLVIFVMLVMLIPRTAYWSH
jgi:hypothetical protein